MTAFEDFDRIVRDALAHLYDPLYEPPDQLYEAAGCPPEQGPACVHAAVIRAIRQLEPPSNVPATTPARRFYELLLYRYVQGLTQEAAAQRLGISPRHLRGLQWKAVRALARSLWRRSGPGVSEAGSALGESVHPTALGQGEDDLDGWASQIRQELESLHRAAPTVVTDVADTIRGVVQLLHDQAEKRAVALKIDVARGELLAAIHPSVLRQALLVAITKLAQSMENGTITVSAELHAHKIAITATAYPVSTATEVDLSFMERVLASEDETVEFSTDGGGATISIEVPIPSKDSGIVTVLVVEDNDDLVSLYRSYVEGTRYRIVHVSQVGQLLPAVEIHEPDVIVLDIMLPEPETDGWELLVGMHDHAATKSLPVVVCSVVREERLALDLGAAVYVPKPVRRVQFVAALDEAISQVP